jgi:hypothetical protein
MTVRRCPKCGGPVPSRSNSGLCYECATGHKTKRHHPWNKASFPEMRGKVPIPGNIHRDLSKLWGERCEALKHPGDDPVNRIAAAVSTIGEAAQAGANSSQRDGLPGWVVELLSLFAKCAKSAAHWLLCLAAALVRRFGKDWAEKLGMPPWSPPEPGGAK